MSGKIQKGFVYLVGAGCGGSELLTLKALECIKNCQVLVYDSLVEEDILSFAPSDCEKIYVGKRYGKSSFLQNDINKIICQKALEGKAVVRLKGGDPFVFGRGGEEAEALEKENIPYEVVTGISSCIAVPERVGIPVTHRDISRSFHVVTARKSNGEPLDRKVLEGFALSGGTLVVLMGLSLLDYITKTLTDCGVSENMPAAIISNGCRENQKVIKTTLKNACKDAEENRMESPAVIVIGETADCVFSGKRENKVCKKLLITGTSGHTEKLSKELKNTKLNVKNLNLSKINIADCEYEFTKGIEKLFKECYTVFTSPNGVQVFFELLNRYGVDVRKLYGTKIAAVGKGTAEKLAKYGIFPDIVPKKFTVSELAKEIVADAENSGINKKIAVAFRSAKGSKALGEILRENGFDFDDICTYSVEPDKKAIEAFENSENNKKFDCVTFSSGSSVKIFFEELKNPLECFSDNTKIICIGEETKKEIDKYKDLVGNMEIITAKKFSCKGLAEAVKIAFACKGELL